MKTNFYLISLLLLCCLLSAGNTNRNLVGIFSWQAWNEGLIATEHFLDWKGLNYERIDYADINSGNLQNFDFLIFPGTSAYAILDNYITEAGRQNIRDFISNGGGYFGLCGGAMYACDSLHYNGNHYNLQLDLFQGSVFGVLTTISNSYDMTTFTMNQDNEICTYLPVSMSIMYAGGSDFTPYAETEVEIIATYDEYLGQPAMINFPYGDGRVVLMGPHPEFEEDSFRDGVAFGDNLQDLGSDWGLLWSAVDWIQGNAVTDTTMIATDDSYIPQNEPSLKIFPNPFNPQTNISCNITEEGIYNLEIYNLKGQLVKTLFHGFLEKGEQSFIWNGFDNDNKTLSSGIYLTKIDNHEFHKIARMVLIK